jgi:hypothetical protein
MSYQVLGDLQDVTQFVNKPVTAICSLWPKDGNRGKWWVNILNTINPFFSTREKQSWQYLLLSHGEVHYLSVGPDDELFEAETYRLGEVRYAVVAQDEHRQRVQFTHGDTEYDYICCEFPFARSGFTKEEYAQFKRMTDDITSALVAGSQIRAA